MWIRAGITVLAVGLVFAGIHAAMSKAQPTPTISISPNVPTELNPPFAAGPPSNGGAPAATPEQASAFAWQEFIALNWPAGPLDGKPNQRDTPSSSCRFGDPNCTGPAVWQTFRGKVEIFPGQGNPPGYIDKPDQSFGYDALPAYNYGTGATVTACEGQPTGAVPWVNLDETDQILLDSMYAGVVSSDSSPGNSSPQLIRFMAKANRSEYTYVAQNQWWKGPSMQAVTDTEAYLSTNKKSPPSGSSRLVSLPDGTIETKAGWRPLNSSEVKSGRFHMQRVRFYEHVPNQPQTSYCYRDAIWGLVALHIIQKTPSAPYFIYATFEQADNLLTADGKPVEDTDGNLLPPAPATPTTPQTCLQNPPPGPGQPLVAQVVLTTDPATCVPLKNPNPVFCSSPGKRLFYRNENESFSTPPPAPVGGDICVNKRDNDIPQYAVDANRQAHAAMQAYFQKNKIASSFWLYYKLINVQYYAYDKVIQTPAPNGSLYTSKPPYTAKNPAVSSFYQANIVVETNRALQLFSGGLTLGGAGVCTDWDAGVNGGAGPQHKNTYYGGMHVNSGGCLGCHGSQGQNPLGKAGDFSVILARGSVMNPEYPAKPDSEGMTIVPRNRTFKK